MTGGATFSSDRRYRYRLWRRWDRTRPIVAFVMLNPSSANAKRDDPTIRRCVGFARRWGFGGVDVVNLYAYRATDPRALARATDPVGRENGRHVAGSVARAGTVVAAWGAHPLARGTRIVRRLGRRAVGCLGLTRSGAPRHPLYLRADARLVPYVRAREVTRS